MAEATPSKASSFMEAKFLPVAARIGGERHLLALRDGIMMTLPLLIVGAFSMIIAEFPVPAFTDFMASVFGDGWNSFEGILMNATYGIASIVACFGVAYSLVNSYKIDGVPAGMISVASLFVIIVPASLMKDGEATDAWTTDMFTAVNLFVALVIALIVGEIYRFFVQRNITLKMPKQVPPTVARQFTALIPGIVILVLFLIVRGLFAMTAWGSFPQFFSDAISTPLRNVGTSYGGTLIAVFAEHFLWSLGLHGSSIVIWSILEPMWLVNMQENVTAIQAGQPAPNIVTTTFYECGVWIGGSGATLPAVIWMLMFAKSKLCKQIGKIAIGPGIFNINEPFTFGMPVVLNPFLMIPFILAPAAVMTVEYIGCMIGFFPISNYVIPWTTPYFVSGFLTTKSFMGVVMNVILFAVAFFIWLPFVRVWDKRCYKQEHEDEDDVPLAVVGAAAA